MPRFTLIILISLLSACLMRNSKSSFSGFWEGPHPSDESKKFYIQIENINDSFTAKGYWTKNSFYQSVFKVDSVYLNRDSISFYVPDWNCTYAGKWTAKGNIKGGFICQDEPFDSVQLIKNNIIENYLLYPLPDFKNSDYRYQYSSPKKLNDNFETSGFQAANDFIFINLLIPEIIAGDYGRINSFLLFKNNKLICEEYFYGYSANDLHQIESCTKSITSLLLGIAKDKNPKINIDEPISEIFPEYSHLNNNGYDKITIGNLLTMTSGFDPQNEELFQSDNPIDFALKRKIVNQPGSAFAYDGGNTEILGAILKKKTGLFADEFALKYLFEPLEINEYEWDEIKDSKYPCMAGSLALKPRDFLKIGVLVLNKGIYLNQGIVSEAWIRESTTVKTKPKVSCDNYGYHWWNLNLTSNEKQYNCIWANGWGSQFIYIIPEINVAIVTTGHNYEYDSWAITDGISKYLYLLDIK